MQFSDKEHTMQQERDNDQRIDTWRIDIRID